MFEGLAVAKKLAALTGCMIASFLAYQTIPESRVKSKLRKVFRAGDLCVTKKVLGKETAIYPVIRSVKITANETIAVFTIPFGLDPAKVEKHEWLFRQQFGENIEMTRDGKRFTLTIPHKRLSTHFKYDYEELRPYIAEMRLPIVAGKSRQGFEVYDMVDYPHLLIAGETGSGKSSQLRSILTTLILAKDSAKLELYLADMKRGEFHLFRRVKHVKNVVFNAPGLESVLIRINNEMKRRGEMLDECEVAHIDDLPEKLPYIVLAIDEVALLKKEKDVMAMIEEIGAIGRALGVFLILSMQRPDKDVLDGKLKNNLTTRMAFRHSDEINSRITLGSGEAASIDQSEKGRHYLKFNGLKLVQAPYLSVPDAKKLLDPFREEKKPEADREQPAESAEENRYEAEQESADDIVLGVLDV